MEFDEVTAAAALLQKAWFVIAGAGWGGTEKTEGWERAAMTFKAEHEAWVARYAPGLAAPDAPA